MYDLVWDERMLGVFRALACLSKEEDLVLTDWANHESITHTSMTHHMCIRTVNNKRKRIRQKYDLVQPYADLPKRNTRT